MLGIFKLFLLFSTLVSCKSPYNNPRHLKGGRSSSSSRSSYSSSSGYKSSSSSYKSSTPSYSSYKNTVSYTNDYYNPATARTSNIFVPLISPSTPITEPQTTIMHWDITQPCSLWFTMMAMDITSIMAIMDIMSTLLMR